MRKWALWILILSLTSDAPYLAESVSFDLPEALFSIGTEENPQARADFELAQLIDPKTGRIPENIRQKELKFSSGHQSRRKWQEARGMGDTEEVWEFAGPTNVGGRTRAAAFDVTDPSGKTLVAGGVSGGIWKTTNSGSTWQRTSDPNLRNSVTAIVQDTRSGEEDTWYAGTGELIGNSARSSIGAPYRGDGIFKSIDGGDSWVQLVSTKDSDPSTFGSQFQYIWRMVIDDHNVEKDVIMVAAIGGILRSEDGGESWFGVLGEELIGFPAGTNLNGNSGPFFTDIAKNEMGHFYAFLSDAASGDEDYADAGIYWSADGIDWFRIYSTGPSDALGRLVMDCTGSECLFFGAIGDEEVLLKYEFQGINAQGRPLGTVSDLSNNLPLFEGLGGLETQGGYNMTVKIHPDDPNLVMLGATNLYRSLDGFSSRANIDWIGGYNSDGDGGLYENHHPDLHDVLIHPAFSRGIVTASDGGLHLTTDIYNKNVTWTSMNNGYVTSQFYTVHTPKEDINETIVGGLQDNGTQMTESVFSASPWEQVLGGDGAFCASVPNGYYWYFSFQNGRIYRFSYGDDFTIFTRVDPDPGPAKTQSTYIFINPFVLDPINYNIMYLAGGNAIWRNNNLAQVPNFSNESTPVNWELLNQTEIDSSLITAVEISQDASQLYFGTSTGELYLVSDLSTSHRMFYLHDFGPQHYISSVAVHPENPDEFLTIISNYGVPSIYYSVDAGETFTDVGGNLEENEDGSGNGPSIRWAELVPLSGGGTRYYLGTSVGLYGTDFLDGNSTVWVREAEDEIGKSVIGMLDYRPLDGFLVVGTHGNGVYKTYVSDFKSIEPSRANAPEKFVAANNYPNPFSDQTTIEFEIPKTEFLKIDIYDLGGNHVRNLFIGPQFAGTSVVTWDGKNENGIYMRDGLYIFRIAFDGQVKSGKVYFNRR